MTKRLLKIISHRRKRLGRGYGSGKGGHTVGKGQKGQKTRRKLSILFEGTKVKKSLIKRLPFLRGKAKFIGKEKPVVVDLKLVNGFPQGTIVNLKYLVKQGIVQKNDAAGRGVKILGNSEVTKKITVAVPISKTASEKIIGAGGKVLKLTPNK